MSTDDSTTRKVDDSGPILIELTDVRQGQGPTPVAITNLFSLKKKPELEQKSKDALDKAMETVRKIADKVNDTMQMIQNKPNHIETEFGIKLDAEFGAIVAKVTAEASMKVKMSWDQPDMQGLLANRR
jgi:uncharacterized FlaG/YvyC family protein